MEANLWSMRAAMLATEHDSVRSEVETEGIQYLARKTNSNHHHGCWDNGWWACDFTEIQPDLKALRDVQASDHGPIDLRWLSGARILGHSLLIDSNGLGITRAQISRISNRGATVNDVVSWKWTSPGRVSFKCESCAYPMATAAANKFRWLCNILVANYPSMLHRPARFDEVQDYSPTEQLWTLQCINDTCQLQVETTRGRRSNLGR